MSTLINTKVKVTISGEVMKGIKKMIKGIKKNKTIDILNYIKFDVKEGRLQATIEHTDSSGHDFTIIQEFNAESDHEGSFLVYIDYIKRIKAIKKGDTFTITGDDERIEITKNGSKQVFRTAAIEEYPKLSKKDSTYLTTVNFDEILKLQHALVSTSKTETRPILQTILIRNGYIASTDSHRLYKTDTTIKHNEDIIITPLGIKKLKDMFNKKDNEIHVSVNENYIKFFNDQAQVLIRLFDGNYPDLERLIPDMANTEFVINDMESFKQMIEDARSISKESRNNVINFEIRQNELVVTATTPEIGHYENTIEIQSMTGEELKLSMSGMYLIEGINQLNSDSLKFQFIGRMRPFTLTPVNSEESMALILPVRM